MTQATNWTRGEFSPQARMAKLTRSRWRLFLTKETPLFRGFDFPNSNGRKLPNMQGPSRTLKVSTGSYFSLSGLSFRDLAKLRNLTLMHTFREEPRESWVRPGFAPGEAARGEQLTDQAHTLNLGSKTQFSEPLLDLPICSEAYCCLSRPPPALLAAISFVPSSQIRRLSPLRGDDSARPLAMAKTLCDWKKSEIEEQSSKLCALLTRPSYYCLKCARSANNRKVLCKPCAFPAKSLK